MCGKYAASMTRQRMTRPEKRALTREWVLEAASGVFPRRGYHDASVDEVAEAAGLSTGAVYSNFGGKADLFLAVYEKQVERWVAELEAAVGEGSTARLADGAAQAWADIVRRDRDWVLVELEFLPQAVRDPELAQRFAELWRAPREASTSLIERAARDFGLALEVEPAELALVTNSLANGLILEKLLDEHAFPDDLVAHWLARLTQPATGRSR